MTLCKDDNIEKWCYTLALIRSRAFQSCKIFMNLHDYSSIFMCIYHCFQWLRCNPVHVDNRKEFFKHVRCQPCDLFIHKQMFNTEISLLRVLYRCTTIANVFWDCIEINLNCPVTNLPCLLWNPNSSPSHRRIVPRVTIVPLPSNFSTLSWKIFLN